MKIFATSLLFCISVFSYSQTDCDESLWNHVYHPYRLILQDLSCLTVTGTVYHVKKEPDGDYHIQLRVDSEYEMYLDDGNYDRQKGCLVLEIICACNIRNNPAADDACQDYENQIPIPRAGDYIKVTGSYVYDKSSAHGWTEIHPVSKLEIVN